MRLLRGGAHAIKVWKRLVCNDFCPPRLGIRRRLHLLKVQRLLNKISRAFGNFTRGTPVCDLHVAVKISYVYGFITKLCRQQAKVI
jgi:hypothetical protein